MDSACLPLKHLPHTSDLLLDYVYHFDRVRHFYDAPPFDPSSYQRVAQSLRHDPSLRQTISDILTRQNRDFGCGEVALENVRRLADPGTFAVVTGQQVGLFSGPAFTLYKALTAVRLARSLSERGLPAVAIFWLAVEDHDLEEVAAVGTLDEEYNLIELRDAGERPAPRSPVGNVRLTGEIESALNALESSLPAGEPREQLLRDLRETYRPGVTWGRAFAGFMARLFSRWGVILIDPLDEALHELGTPVYQRALARASELRSRLLDRSRALIQHGYHAQVHVGEDSTLLFVTREGNRVPLHQREGRYLLDGSEERSTAGLETILKEHPLDFSPNVLLRPVVQDFLLPTVAYVAGPSELTYFAQAQSIYEAFSRPMPVIFPRVGFTLVDQRSQRLLEKYQLTVEDVFQGQEHLNRKITAAAFAEGWSERFDQSERDLVQILGRLEKDIATVDPTLLDTLRHTKEKMAYQLERLRGKLSRAAISRSELLGRHEQSLLRLLAPHNDLQERRVSGAYFLGRAGYELLDRLLAHIPSGCADHQVLVY